MPMADDLSSNPTFTALPSKAGSEWYVLVSWHDGRVPEHVTGFQTEDDARDWILKMQRIGSKREMARQRRDRPS
jgi:hypothetical protein